MPGSVIGKSLTFGYPGSFARMPDQIIRSYPVAAAVGDIPFGGAVMRAGNDGTVKPAASLSDATSFLGVAVRQVQSAKVYPQQNVGVYSANEIADVILRGAVSVTVSAGAPAIGGAVYIRKATGLFVTAPEGAAGADTLLLSNCQWGSEADANNVAELVLLERTGA
jgi:hypothetical protein